MADISITDLIHAGIPWSNPEKITVKSDQYISQMVINRGLLNLLSNDYYLDLKAERLNQYVQNVLKKHIDDDTIHHTEEQIIEIINRYLNDGESGVSITGLGLTSNTTFALPLYQDNSKAYTYIKQIIQQCPKNLNGHTLIFALSVPLSRVLSDDIKYATNMDQANDSSYTKPTEDYTLSLSDNNISFDSFYGGTLIITGNDQFFFDDLNSDKTINYNSFLNAIPTRDTRLLYEHIQNQLLLSSIVKPNIQLQGTGLNSKFSVLSFRDCQTDTYLYNLQIKNNKSTSETIQQTTSNLPYYNDLAVYYPMNIQQNTNQFIPQSINNQVFENLMEEQVKLYSKDYLLSGYEDSMYYTKLNNNYLYFDSILDQDKNISNIIRKLIYGKYIKNSEIKYDSLSGSSLSFWMRCPFNTNDYQTIPIIYDSNSTEELPNGDGVYIGLQRLAVYEQGTQIKRKDTSYISSIKESFDEKWVLWNILFDRSDNNLNVTIKYFNNGALNTLSPNSINLGSLSGLTFNQDNDIKLFGYRDYQNNTDRHFEADIRNIMFFNKILTDTEIQAIGNEGIVQYYDWNEFHIPSEVINNSIMYSSVYAYNTDMLNIINCYLIEG